MKKIFFLVFVVVFFIGCGKDYDVQYRVSGGCTPAYFGSVTINYMDGTGNTQIEAASHNLNIPWTKTVRMKSGQTAIVSVYPNNICPAYGLYNTSLYINNSKCGSENRTISPTQPEVDTTTYKLP
jgi:hypothetical protein